MASLKQKTREILLMQNAQTGLHHTAAGEMFGDMMRHVSAIGTKETASKNKL